MSHDALSENRDSLLTFLRGLAIAERLRATCDKMIRNEGGFKLTNIEGDRGGQTYAGISRNAHPNWPGWRYVDADDS